MSPRPEIVLPPGFALRIDYDPESSPASLLITAYRDDAPVGQAHVDPRDVGLRLRLELEHGEGASEISRAPRLRLTPERAMQPIVMGAVQVPMPTRELPAVDDAGAERAVQASGAAASITSSNHATVDQHPAVAALQALAREGALVPDDLHDTPGHRHSPNALVWLEDGIGVVLPSASSAHPLAAFATRVGRQLREDVRGADRGLARVQRALRALSGAAADLVGNPLRLREADESWISWRGSWRGVHQASGAGEG